MNLFVPFHIMEAGWDEFKKWATLIYPDSLPPIRDLHLPVVKSSTFAAEMTGLGLKFYAIDNNRFVYLVENQEEEEWEVHVVDI